MGRKKVKYKTKYDRDDRSYDLWDHHNNHWVEHLEGHQGNTATLLNILRDYLIEPNDDLLSKLREIMEKVGQEELPREGGE